LPLHRLRLAAAAAHGRVEKKIFAWHIGFWGERGSGWHCELMLVLMNRMIAFTLTRE
jgi:hypothetical protein